MCCSAAGVKPYCSSRVAQASLACIQGEGAPVGAELEGSRLSASCCTCRCLAAWLALLRVALEVVLAAGGVRPGFLGSCSLGLNPAAARRAAEFFLRPGPLHSTRLGVSPTRLGTAGTGPGMSRVETVGVARASTARLLTGRIALSEAVAGAEGSRSDADGAIRMHDLHRAENAAICCHHSSISAALAPFMNGMLRPRDLRGGEGHPLHNLAAGRSQVQVVELYIEHTSPPAPTARAGSRAGAS